MTRDALHFAWRFVNFYIANQIVKFNPSEVAKRLSGCHSRLFFWRAAILLHYATSCHTDTRKCSTMCNTAPWDLYPGTNSRRPGSSAIISKLRKKAKRQISGMKHQYSASANQELRSILLETPALPLSSDIRGAFWFAVAAEQRLMPLFCRWL